MTDTRDNETMLDDALGVSMDAMEAEIEAAKTPRGGWTRETLASWGVPWPPPKGWRKRLIAAAGQRHGIAPILPHMGRTKLT